MFVSVSIYLLVESPVTSFPWMEARSCLRVSTTTTIIITRVGKPSRTIDLLGPSFLIHAETSKGVNSTIGCVSGFRTCFVRVWKPLMAILCLREAAGVFGPMTCVRMVKACVRMCAYVCTTLKVESDSLSHLNYGSSTKVSL